MPRDAARQERGSFPGELRTLYRRKRGVCHALLIQSRAMPASPGTRPTLRSDARRNRRRLLEAARGVMRQQGLEASLGEIARRAGVGNATLYRHFPTREALWEAVFAEYGSELEEIRERVLRIP